MVVCREASSGGSARRAHGMAADPEPAVPRQCGSRSLPSAVNPVWSTSPATRGSTQIASRATSAGTPCTNGDSARRSWRSPATGRRSSPLTPTRPT